MKAKNINDDNLEINEENYAAYERLMEDYISLTQHPDSKYNLDNNAENFFDKLIFIPITTLIGLVATTSFESPIPFILVSATGISTMIYSLVKYDTIGKNLKPELKKRHPNIDTDVDFQELDSKLYEYVRSTITRNQESLDHEEYNRLVTEYVSSVERSLTPKPSEEKNVSDQKKLELSYKDLDENN